jgi:hypothetical protein
MLMSGIRSFLESAGQNVLSDEQVQELQRVIKKVGSLDEVLRLAEDTYDRHVSLTNDPASLAVSQRGALRVQRDFPVASRGKGTPIDALDSSRTISAFSEPELAKA